MVDNLKARLFVILAVFMACVIWFMPNLMGFAKLTEKQLAEKWWPSKKTLALGLDIQGGLHLVMGIDKISAMEAQLQKTGARIIEDLKQNKKVTVDSVEPLDLATGKIRISFSDPASRESIVAYMEDNRTGQGGTFQVLQSTPTSVEAKYYEAQLQAFETGLVERTIETIRNRVDDLGVKEPIITAQSNGRIVIQLAGQVDATEAKELINKTAKLEFMIVDPEFDYRSNADNLAKLTEWVDQAEKDGGFALGQDGLKLKDYLKKVNEALKDKLPKNTVLRFEKQEGAKDLATGKVPYVLRTDSMMTGETLENAGVTTGDLGEPVVFFQFDSKGAKLFGDLTTANVQKLMAIVLDGVVKTAPNLRGPIPGGSGTIELGRSGDREAMLEEANLIARVLRSGALPAELEQLEERTVGSTLGADSIQKGQFAGLIGGMLVLLFMLAYYRNYGVLADVALLFNVLMVLAVLTNLQATLTLPGVAGIALTIGMAVDANVIIFERIKEEIRKGSGLKASIKEGYARAFWAIFDANITTAAVCMVLMYFGSGPIKGFAVTLICGIATSMFTAIFFTRTLLAVLVDKWKWNFTPIKGAQ